MLEIQLHEQGVSMLKRNVHSSALVFVFVTKGQEPQDIQVLNSPEAVWCARYIAHEKLFFCDHFCIFSFPLHTVLGRTCDSQADTLTVVFSFHTTRSCFIKAIPGDISGAKTRAFRWENTSSCRHAARCVGMGESVNRVGDQWSSRNPGFILRTEKRDFGGNHFLGISLSVLCFLRRTSLRCLWCLEFPTLYSSPPMRLACVYSNSKALSFLSEPDLFFIIWVSWVFIFLIKYLVIFLS